MRTPPTLPPDPLCARPADEPLEGLVGGHLAARAMQRRILMVGSVIGLAGIAVLISVLLPGAPTAIGPL